MDKLEGANRAIELKYTMQSVPQPDVHPANTSPVADDKKMKTKNKKKATEKKSRRTPRVAIAPRIIEDVRKMFGYDEHEATAVIATHASLLVERSKDRRPKKYWSSLDTQALFVLLDNMVVTHDVGQFYLKQCQVFERWVENESGYNDAQKAIIDRLIFFFQFCFSNCTLKTFYRRLDRIVDNYTPEQYSLILLITEIAIRHFAQTEQPPGTPQVLIDAVVDIVGDVFANTRMSSDVRHHPVKRLVFIRDRVSAKQLADEQKTTSAMTAGAAGEAVAKEKKIRSRSRRVESDSGSGSGSGSDSVSGSDEEEEEEYGNSDGGSNESDASMEYKPRRKKTTTTKKPNRVSATPQPVKRRVKKAPRRKTRHHHNHHDKPVAK